MVLWGLAVLVFVAVAAIVVMLVVRRNGPERGFLHDPVPAASVFGVLGVAFAVLLAFVVFLAFEGYLRAFDGASKEAVAVTQLMRVARLFPAEQSEELRGDLACYARAVVADEWPAMASGGESDLVDQWLKRLETTVDELPVDSPRTTVALQHWLDEMSARREGRRTRLYQAVPKVPEVVWLMLLLGAGLTVSFLLLYADRRDRWWTQATLIGSVTTLVVSGLLVVVFLDRPFQRDGAYVGPGEMETSLRLIDEELALDLAIMLPCDEAGRPLAAA